MSALHTEPATAVAGSAPVAGQEPVVVRGLVKKYGSVLACDQLDLSVRRGELVALVGRSGSGKSTLLRVLNGLVAPSAGEVRVLDEDVRTLRSAQLRALRRRVGMVFQQFQLVGRLTAMENVLTGALGRVRGPRYGVLTWPKGYRREAIEQLDRVGLGDRAFQRVDTLSGGQQQRVAIARMLMQRPALVLADEPVASLDPETSAQVLDILFRICGEDELTVLCSLHQVDLVLEWAHRVVGMRSGAIVLDAPADGLARQRLDAVYRDV
ncbi:MAG: phosphonate ABC transporter ATP-binding protein [Streptosporangiales bacterium]|nr:phosphonate ABC transporter ATP-binding protein [Streptosporangiales bacterium]